MTGDPANIDGNFFNEPTECMECMESRGSIEGMGELSITARQHRVAIARSIKREVPIFGADAEQTDQQEGYEAIAEVLEDDV